MRTLNQTEIDQVSGGLLSEAEIAAATRVVRATSYLGLAFSSGYAMGTWLYNNGVGELIAEALD